MNIKRWIAVSVASLAITALFSINAANAQTKVAIVDVGAIFKQHPSFAGQLEALKVQADGFKAEALQAQQSLAVSAKSLQESDLKPDSGDFRNQQTKLAQKAAAMQVEQNGLMQKLMEKEAMLHFDTYQQVNALISQYCDDRGIQLVLRYNNQKMDLAQPGSVMQRVNSSVIYHDPNNDITQAIVGQLSKVAQGAGSLERR